MRKIITYINILFLFFAINSFSQVTGSILVTATVLNPISITTTRDLDFGNDIVPGIFRTIDKTSATSGKFSISGQPSKEVNITLTLPSTLINGPNTLPISFTNTDGGYKTTSGNLITFNPSVPINASLGSDGKLDIFLGGKVTPSHNQISGLYFGTINISLYYTGN